MSLSCTCDFDMDEGDRIFYPPADYNRYDRHNSRLCQSCGETRIHRGGVVNMFRVTVADHYSEARGEWIERELAPVYHCEACADIYWSLQALGFECVHGGENMRQLARA